MASEPCPFYISFLLGVLLGMVVGFLIDVVLSWSYGLVMVKPSSDTVITYYSTDLKYIARVGSESPVGVEYVRISLFLLFVISNQRLEIVY